MKKILTILTLILVAACTATASAKKSGDIAKFAVGEYGIDHTYHLKKNGKVYDTAKYDRASGGNYATTGGAYLVVIDLINGMPDYFLIYDNTAYNFVETLSDQWIDLMNKCVEADGSLDSAKSYIDKGIVSFDPATQTITIETATATLTKPLSEIPSSQRFPVTWLTRP